MLLDSKILALFFDIAERNRDKIINMLKEKRIVGINPHGGYTRYFDKAIESLIIGELRKSGYEGYIVGEELGISDGKREEWIYIDPLDGSHNVARGINFYCLSVAYGTGSRIDDVKSALVWDIPNDVYYVAEKGKGAYRLYGNKMERIKTTRKYDVIILDVGFTIKEKCLKKIAEIGTFRRLGSIIISSMKVAEGMLEGIFDVNKLRATDVAAAYLILQEANAYAYVEPKEIHTNPTVRFIAAKNKDIYDMLMQIYKNCKD